MTKPWRFILPLTLSILIGFVVLPTDARQYKSRLFTDSNQNLGEAAAQTISELEAAFGTYQDSYQIATTGRYLAQQMIASKQYDKAVEYYQQVLATETLEATIQTQIRIELAKLFLHLKGYEEVKTLFVESDTTLDISILLAKANLGLKMYHTALKDVDPFMSDVSKMTNPQLKQVATIHYIAGALPKAAELLEALLHRQPDDLNLARQITGIYIKLEKFQAALTTWSLAYVKKLLVEERDLLLLAELYAKQGAPEKAARVLTEGMLSGLVIDSAEHYYKQFGYYYNAREMDLAIASLQNSVQKQPNLEYSLLLAELLQNVQRWQELLDTVLFACQQILPDSFVSRTNMLLGVAYHKTGDDELARRAWINASLMSGQREKAQQWLQFIEATPATREESKELWGPCVPADKAIALPDSEPELASDSEENLAANSQANQMELTLKTLPTANYYGTSIPTTPESLLRDIKIKTFALMKALLRTGGSVDGPMHLVFEQLQAEDSLKLTIAFPYKGKPSRSGRHQVHRLPEQRAVTTNYNGPAENISEIWKNLVENAIAQGFIPNGEARMVFLSDTSGTGTLDVELQLIVE